jgi:ubiquinone/menaquinone biosynthesis C-methylase UbiE
MCSANPAYQDNLTLFRTWMGSAHLPTNPTICDVGAGTGNYALETSKLLPSARVIHLDSDPVMNRTASKKYRDAGAENIEFRCSNVFDARFAPSSLDLIICVNALYTFASTATVLGEFRSWLKPRGQLFLIDLGRPMKVADWSRYIISTSVREHGVRATLKSFVRGRKAIGQNRLIRREQELGRYWLHSPEEFMSTVSAAGFEITNSQTCYRGVCDLAVCHKVR